MEPEPCRKKQCVELYESKLMVHNFRVLYQPMIRSQRSGEILKTDTGENVDRYFLDAIKPRKRLNSCPNRLTHSKIPFAGPQAKKVTKGHPRSVTTDDLDTWRVMV